MGTPMWGCEVELFDKQLGILADHRIAMSPWIRFAESKNGRFLVIYGWHETFVVDLCEMVVSVAEIEIHGQTSGKPSFVSRETAILGLKQQAIELRDSGTIVLQFPFADSHEALRDLLRVYRERRSEQIEQMRSIR
jgi:hypothetical protein